MKKFFYELKKINSNMNRINKGTYIVLALVIFIFLIEKIKNNPEILIMIPILILSIILHEIAHGYVAYLNGDDTSKKLGRLTLNPIKHVDILGFFLPVLLIFFASSFVIGWAKPIPVNYNKLKNKNIGIFLVSIAGVLTNLILAILGTILYKKLFPINNEFIYNGIIYLIKINVTLFIFNILPIPPLDGSKIITAFGNDSVKMKIYQLEKYGFIIIFILLYTGILNLIMNPFYDIIYKILNLIVGV